MKEKIIIDCDPGVDDALAICLAHMSNAFDILAITSIFGNMDVETTTKNIEYIKHQINLPTTKVFKGASQPIDATTKEQTYYHGYNGLKDIAIRYPMLTREDTDSIDGMLALINKYPHQITIVAIGPLTNIARMIQKDKAIIPLIKDLIVMGGSAFTRGNITAKAEANFYNDPKAVDIILKSGLLMHMIGLDVTLQPRIYPKEIIPLLQKTTKAPAFIKDLMAKIFIIENNTILETKGTAFHDPLTIAYLLNPNIVTFTPHYMEIETMKGALCEGACIVDTRTNAPIHNIRIATNVDTLLYKDMLFKTLF